MELSSFVSSLGLGKTQHIEQYIKGQHNQTYKVTSDKGIFSLRVYTYKKSEEIQFELAVLKKLKDLPVPHILSLRGKTLHNYNAKYALVYAYLPGESLQHFTSEQLKQVGIFLAQFHTHCRSFVWSKPRYQFYNLPDWKINKFTSFCKEKNIDYLEYLPNIISDLKSNRLHLKLPKGPIHVDVKPENVLFYKGKLSGVLDFDNAFIGPFLLDLAKSIVWFGTQNKKFSFHSVSALYQGYISIRLFTALEKQEFYKAIKFAFLSHIFVDYYMYATGATTREYFDFIVNDLYAAYKTFTMTKKEFDILFS